MKKNLPNSLAAAALLLLPAGLLAQATGTSHPEDLNDTITTTAPPQPHYVKPSAAIPMAPAETALPAQSTQQPVLLQRVAPPPSAACSPAQFGQMPPAAGVAAPMQTAKAANPESGFVVTDDPNSGVVMEVPSAPDELPVGTLLHTRLAAEISTITTERGAPFSARLMLPLVRHHEILLPSGSIVSGRIAEVHAGNRMHGGAIIQLIPDFVTLPDGTKRPLDAQVIDLPAVQDARVSDEGVIHGTSNVKATAAAVGLTTASTTVAGAMVGGGVGAAVGATVGVGVATVWYFKHEQEQTLREGTEVVFSLDRPLHLEPAPR